MGQRETSLNWKSLRPWNNSINSGFEELCCQLAEYEPVPQGSRFVRKGTPDGGVECFWTLPSGTEWGWQAKFLFLPFGPTQWKELDQSVKTALNSHRLLTRYTICLPLDRPDARLDKQRSFLDRWNERTKNWQLLASRMGRTVDFLFWGSHEISDRLSRPEHAGRTKFWFDSEFFSYSWFESQLNAVKANAGERYTAALNIKLPIARAFEGLGRTDSYYLRFAKFLSSIRNDAEFVPGKKLSQINNTEALSLRENLSLLYRDLAAIGERPNGPLDFDALGRPALESLRRCIDILREKQESVSIASPGSALNDETTEETKNRLEAEINNLWRVANQIRHLREFILDKEAIASNRAALLVVGAPGAGKTHLLCDVAFERNKCRYPTLMVLGEQFDSGEPWRQIISLIGLDCTRDELLGALDAASQAAGANALIIIDALNEGEGTKIWRKHLAGMIAHLERYPRIRFALSVRGSYESLVVPSQLHEANQILRIEHRGFEEREYEATNRFFGYFGIEPTLPHLYPEFSNPQFLMLFCRSLKNRGLRRVPTGLQGITSIFQFYIDAIDDKLALPNFLNYDRADRLCYKAVGQIAKEMAREGRRWLRVPTAKRIIDKHLPGRQFDSSLYRHLISEGVFAEDLFMAPKNSGMERGIRFSYERFADHIIAQHLLASHLNRRRPSSSFKQSEPLGRLFSTGYTAWQNQGVIEALSIQLPEVLGKEIPDVIPTAVQGPSIRRAFIDSLLWRKRSAFDADTFEYINCEILRYSDSSDRFWDVVLTLAPIPGHPLNADFLHRNLQPMQVAERDSWWTKYIHQSFQQESALDRMLDWPWYSSLEPSAEEDSLVLYGIALCWLFTSSNRFLRDKATKTLVKLLDDRIPVFLRVAEKLQTANDPYVIERLCCAAYGLAMRCKEKKHLQDLGQFFYEWIFAQGHPPEHLLIRDYARGVVEAALQFSTGMNLDVSKIRPPYGSKWPQNIPSATSLKAKYGIVPQQPKPEEWSQHAIYESVMGFGDFARYVIGTNSGISEFSSSRLGRKPRLTLAQRYTTFAESLTGRKAAAWKKFNAARSEAQLAGWRELLDRNEKNPKPLKTLDARARRAETSLIALLSRSERAIYSKYVTKYLASNGRENDQFDLSILQRWILQRVFELGWTVERFGMFDRDVDRGYGREAKKAERIGKKYQWIAFYEGRGLITDNFRFIDRWRERDESYSGPWQIHERNIDPSCTLRRLQDDEAEVPNSWWCPRGDYKLDKGSTREWLERSDDLPSAQQFIELTNSSDRSEWIALLQYPDWKEDREQMKDQKRPRRSLWYQIRSYLVPRQNEKAVFDWLSKQHFWGQWMEWVRDYHGTFLGEFYWAPSLRSADETLNPTAEHESSKLSALPSRLELTAAHYHPEQGSFDCSIDSSFSLYLPGRALMEGMGLDWRGHEGMYFDKRGKLIAFDPAVTEKGPNALLVSKPELLEFLHSSGQSMIWTVLGAKQVMSEWSATEWPGELQMSGAYRLMNGKVTGRMRPLFIGK